MKTKIFFMLMLIMMLPISLVNAECISVKAIYNTNIRINYEGSTLEFKNVNNEVVYPFSYEGTTYLPVRAIASLFNKKINYDAEKNSIYITDEENDITVHNFTNSFFISVSTEKDVVLNKDISIYYNGELQTFKNAVGEVAYPISFEGTTYLPIRAISNLFNKEIQYVASQDTINIYDGIINEFDVSDNVSHQIILNDYFKLKFDKALTIDKIVFPFDVYVHSSINDEQYFVKSGDNILTISNVIEEEDDAKNSVTFTLPVYVEEKEYVGLLELSDGNKIDTNLKVIGKIFDFDVRGTEDPNWQNFIPRRLEKSLISNYFPVGNSLVNWNRNYKYALKLGYPVGMSIKTYGTRSNSLQFKFDFKYVNYESKENVLEDITIFCKSPNGYVIYGEEPYIYKYELLKKELKAETSELVETTKFIVPPINYTLKNDITFQNNKMTIPYASRLISNYDYFNDVISIDNHYGDNNTINDLLINYGSEYSGDVLVKDNKFYSFYNSIGHWYFMFNLPSSTVAIRNSDIEKMGYKEINNDIANDIVVKALLDKLVCRNGCIVVCIDVCTLDDNGEYIYYSWNGNNRSFLNMNEDVVEIPNNSVMLYEADRNLEIDINKPHNH